ncbi:tetratricopeptide repeat protein [Chondromyces crocatus]|uniref:Uncharacterized protein n=1 Tax=Chondromyces crocatus TaxID=52 RepID=A0A0K1E9L4_CHOCO|nr:tetratricopeptide repeat protein [Chondromyces crocatus]AKT37377.1 uncharacterized protein CMC5_015120 [Chondromyces crocatus]
MRSGLVTLGSTMVMLLGAWLGGSEANAQSTQASLDALDQAKEEARASADRGFEHFEAGRFEEAIRAFEEAHAKYPAPTILLKLAQANARIGRLREARRHYLRVVDEKLALYAPRAFFETQEQAKVELEALLPRLPSLQVSVTGAPADQVRLVIDGRASERRVVVLDPGIHTVTATAPGRASVTQKVTLQEGRRHVITLRLLAPSSTRSPHSTPEAGSERGTPVVDEPEESGAVRSSRRNVLPAVGAFGLAGVAVGVGAVTGALSLGATASMEKECLDFRCYDGAGGEHHDRAGALGAVSTVSFVVAGVAAGVGVGLLLWPAKSDGRPAVALRVSPGWMGVEGTF